NPHRLCPLARRSCRAATAAASPPDDRGGTDPAEPLLFYSARHHRRPEQRTASGGGAALGERLRDGLGPPLRPHHGRAGGGVPYPAEHQPAPVRVPRAPV